MQPLIEIFSQGEEVLTGQTVDTNAAWLAQKLVDMGFIVKRHTVVGDNLQDLQSLLQEISLRADCCICTGGLGPTVDDLTAQAVAEAFEMPLQLDPIALKQIEQHFMRRKRVMANANRKQAYFPQGAERIDNEWGTAPGFSVQQGRCWFAFVPGVPYEMQAMFDEKISALLMPRFSLQPDRLITLRSVGIGESDLQEKLNKIQIPEAVQLSFRAGADEVQTKLLFPAATEQAQIHALVSQVVASIGDYVFAVDNLDRKQGGLVDTIDQLMLQSRLSLAVQETATHGLIATKCILRPWLVASNFKQSLVHIAEKLGVSIIQGDYLRTAENIAIKIRQQERTDLVLVQLYRGSAQRFQKKNQNIILYIVLLTPEGARSSVLIVGGSVKRKQNQSAIMALDLLRRYLQQQNASE